MVGIKSSHSCMAKTQPCLELSAEAAHPTALESIRYVFDVDMLTRCGTLFQLFEQILDCSSSAHSSNSNKTCNG